MGRLIDLIIARPSIFALLTVIALVLLPVAVWFDLKHMSDATLRQEAEPLDGFLAAVRDFYRLNVEEPVLAGDGSVAVSHRNMGTAGHVPTTATAAIELGNALGAQSDRSSFRLISDLPFASREPPELTPFEADALARFRSGTVADPVLVDFEGSLFNRTIRYASPLTMKEACVTCHNQHPDSPKLTWAVGDVRGLSSIELTLPVAPNLSSFRNTTLYLCVASLFAAAISTGLWRRTHAFAALNGELSRSNLKLAAVSQKLAKYLPSQVFNRIFSGERDVVISTERKKLTVFVADLKDFSIISETLQPEDLAALLNEYFTEMAQIADAYGATIDKFVGDAIIAFFGDPETHGTQADAKACVAMAIAMQRRLVTLNAKWTDRGVRAPLAARMGIASGYRNVGNFGSPNRMDYTIIGAEVNLASRLESIADPGGIVLSYETYRLVADEVAATPMSPISLKGFSREVVPYRVTGIYGPMADEARIIHEVSDAARIYLDIDRLTDAERTRVADVLRKAVVSLATPPAGEASARTRHRSDA